MTQVAVDRGTARQSIARSIISKLAAAASAKMVRFMATEWCASGARV